MHFGDDPMRREEKELQKSIKGLLAKMDGDDPSPIVNADIVKYLRVINFNFAALQGLIQAIYIRQGVLEESTLDIYTKQAEILEKVSAFLESQTLLEESLDDDPLKSPDGEIPV